MRLVLPDERFKFRFMNQTPFDEVYFVELPWLNAARSLCRTGLTVWLVDEGMCQKMCDPAKARSNSSVHSSAGDYRLCLVREPAKVRPPHTSIWIGPLSVV